MRTSSGLTVSSIPSTRRSAAAMGSASVRGATDESPKRGVATAASFRARLHGPHCERSCVGELPALTWGDIDGPRGRWRVSAALSKTGAARWVDVPTVLFAAVTALVPRDDRIPERRVFQGFGSARFRTALGRACTAAGVPAFSPHDLRHRRVSLLHLGGMPWARIGELVGHGDTQTRGFRRLRGK